MEKARLLLVLGTGLVLILAWGLPALVQHSTGRYTMRPLRLAGAWAIHLGTVLQLWGWVLLGATVVAEVMTAWAWRQRRRLVRMITNTQLLKVKHSGKPVRVIAGLWRPRRGVVPIMPGHVVTDLDLAHAAREVGKGWGRAYAVRHDPRHDRIVVRRLRRSTPITPTEPKPEYVDDIHERLYKVGEAVKLDVLSIDVVPAGDPDAEGHDRMRYRVRYAPKAEATTVEFQEKFAKSVTEMVGPTAAGKLLAATWEPHADTVWFDEAQDAEPTYLDAMHQRLVQILPAMPTQFKVLDVQAAVEPDEDGNPAARYKLTYAPHGAVTKPAFQDSVADAISELVGTGPTGGRLESQWRPAEDLVVLSEVPPLEGFIQHPVITDYQTYLGTDRLVIPYGTFAGNKPMAWDIDPKSTSPHCLIAGPTGAGKTVTERSIISEGCRLGIPWILWDPKYFELMEFDDYPGVFTVMSDPRHMALGIITAHQEHQERKRVIRKERLDPGRIDHVPLWGMVFDELLVMAGMLARLCRRDEDIKAEDPLGLYKELVHEVRATGGRMLNVAQRPDADIWGSGSPRMNMGHRIALSRMDKDGDDMMFPGGTYYTRHLDTGVPGRAMATLLNGNPREGQVWFTPNLDNHPRKVAERTPAQQQVVDELKPATPPKLDLFLPRAKLSAFFMRVEDFESGGKRPAQPLDKDSAPAFKIRPGWRIVTDQDGEDVPATVVDIEEVDHGAGLEFEIRIDGVAGTSTWVASRDEWVGIIARTSSPT